MMLNVVLIISLTAVEDLSDCKMQMLTALERHKKSRCVDLYKLKSQKIPSFPREFIWMFQTA